MLSWLRASGRFRPKARMAWTLVMQGKWEQAAWQNCRELQWNWGEWKGEKKRGKDDVIISEEGEEEEKDS